MRFAKLFSAFLLGLVVACSDRGPTSPQAAPSAGRSESIAAEEGHRRPATRALAARGGTPPALQGVWGGNDIGLTVTVSGASVEYDCAAGSIDAPLVPDAAGRFDLPGTTWFTPPVLFIGWQPDKRPARYSGIVLGNTMTLTVTRLEDDQIARFQLIRRAIPRLLRCL